MEYLDTYISHGNVKYYNHFGKIIDQFLKILNTHLPYDPAIPFLGVCPRETKTYDLTKSWMRMFTVAFFIIAQNRQQSKYPPTGEWINRGPYIFIP